ncbi:single-stranded DNA binding protein [Vibrio phage nt-1]|uniref:Single-stranded DNA-binding protein n=1 Tax=Vibrio phage nt-1 TaxID=115992 RepID=R9TI87_9CAUD|nr:single strand DNA binding protein [Vibrio phage nt-1]AGN30055.2 single-stranded DNA binding protein [Vibrio phage nt-1]
MSMFKRKSPAQLQEKLEKLDSKKSFDKADEWKLSTDKLGNGSAVIRFLPSKGEDDLPFVKIFTHGFKENGNWFIENCPSTIDLPCPCCAANGELWKTENEDNQNIARKRKRTLSYWANIIVLKDDAAPENEGKVFKYRFGKKILDKITQAAQADEDLGLPGMDVTCVFDGANFSLKAKKVSGFPNYDDSKFGPSTELYGGDEDKLKEVWESMHDLNAIIAPSAFKSEGDLQKRFLQVTGAAQPKASAAQNLEAQLNTSAPAQANAAKTVTKSEASIETQAPASTEAVTDSVDDELDALLADLELDD